MLTNQLPEQQPKEKSPEPNEESVKKMKVTAATYRRKGIVIAYHQRKRTILLRRKLPRISVNKKSGGAKQNVQI